MNIENLAYELKEVLESRENRIRFFEEAGFIFLRDNTGDKVFVTDDVTVRKYDVLSLNYVEFIDRIANIIAKEIQENMEEPDNWERYNNIEEYDQGFSKGVEEGKKQALEEIKRRKRKRKRNGKK